MKGRESDNEMINICSQIIDKNIINLLNTINYLKEENKKIIKNEQRNEETEKEIKQSTQLIQISTLIREKVPEHNWETRIPDQMIKLIKERIVPLIHINCPSYIKCQQCISVVSSAPIQYLHIAIFQALAEVSQNNKEFFNLLLKDHNIILHLTYPIIQFVSQSQINKKIIQQQSDSFDLSFISSSINPLNNLTQYNTEVCKQIINTPNLLNSLVKLTEFKFNNNTIKEDNQSFQIRNKSKECLRSIHYFGDEQAQVELVTNGYPRVLASIINTAGGHEQQQDEGIGSRMVNITQFIRVVLEGRQYSFPPQPILFKSCQEQIEEEGANEEIDTQLVNKGIDEGGGDYIKDSADEAKRMILNFYAHWSNPAPMWWYQ